MSEANPMKNRELFNSRATVKLDQPVTAQARSDAGGAKSGNGKYLFLAMVLAVVALIFFLKT